MTREQFVALGQTLERKVQVARKDNADEMTWEVAGYDERTDELILDGEVLREKLVGHGRTDLCGVPSSRRLGWPAARRWRVV